MNMDKIVTAVSENPEADESWASVIGSSGRKLIILDIHQDWCGPCEVFHPKLHRMSLELDNWSERCAVYSVSMKSFESDVEALLPPESFSTLKKNGSIPFTAFIKQREVVDTISGADTPKLISLLKKHLLSVESGPAKSE